MQSFSEKTCGVIFYEIYVCDRMWFEACYAKSYNRIISEAQICTVAKGGTILKEQHFVYAVDPCLLLDVVGRAKNSSSQGGPLICCGMKVIKHDFFQLRVHFLHFT